MADIEIIFKGSAGSITEENQLQVYHNSLNEITISILDKDYCLSDNPLFISLSKETAIKFHRELKKQISFIEKEVDNG